MLVHAALVPTPPLLVPGIGGPSSRDVRELRTACRDVVVDLLAAQPEVVVVLGTAPTAGSYEGRWDWRGFGVAEPAQPVERRLPLALAIGGWLLDEAGGADRRYVGVPDSSGSAECAALGQELCSGPARVALLVCGDGSAAREEKAPGHHDPRALPWDEAAVRALGDGDTAAVLKLDAPTARAVLASGRAPWQVLAGAARGLQVRAQLAWVGAPYGVLYVAGSWQVC